MDEAVVQKPKIGFKEVSEIKFEEQIAEVDELGSQVMWYSLAKSMLERAPSDVTSCTCQS